MKKNFSWICLMLLAICCIYLSCDDDGGSSGTGSLTLELNGITRPGSGFVYGVWIRQSADYTYLGDFTINANNNVTNSIFPVGRIQLEEADGVLISLEKEDQVGSSPAETRFLAGDFINRGANLTITHTEAIGQDFDNATAGYILATPTDNIPFNENSGVWFYDTTTMQSTLIEFPVLPAAWTYESWIVLEDTIRSMGRFRDVNLADDSNVFGSDVNPLGFNVPGQDFLNVNEQGTKSVFGEQVFISVEPTVDDATTPFGIRPFLETIVDTLPASPVPITFVEIGLPIGIARR